MARGRAIASFQRRRQRYRTDTLCSRSRCRAAELGARVMRKIRNPIGQVSLSAIEDQWQRDAGWGGAGGVVQVAAPTPPATPIGRVSDAEWGWIVAAVLFAWISKRAEHAAAEQLDTEQCIRMTALDPQPWDAGAVAAIL